MGFEKAESVKTNPLANLVPMSSLAWMIILVGGAPRNMAGSEDAGRFDDKESAYLSRYVVSQQRSNIFVVFASAAWDLSTARSQGDPRDATFPADVPIAFGFGAGDASRYQVFRLAPEYGIRLVATSGSGRLVARTRLGKTYGSKFSELSQFEEGALDRSGQYYEKTEEKGHPRWTLRRAGHGQPYVTLAVKGEISPSTVFPPPQDLFKFEKPGVYLLRVEVQCFSRLYPPRSLDVPLVTFQPVVLRILKREKS